jgi:hypothetical protein
MRRRPQPWLLQDGAGAPSHRGLLEGGLSGSAASAGYFVLLREGEAFTAIPADEFYNFRPTQRWPAAASHRHHYSAC